MIYVTRGRNPVSCVLAVNVSLIVASACWIPYPHCQCFYCILPIYIQYLKSEILDPVFVSFWLTIVVSLFVLQLCFAFCSAFVLQRLQLAYALCFALLVAQWFIRWSFLVGLLNCLGDCDWLFVLGHAMVQCLIRLVLCDCDLLVVWLAIFTRFSCCDSNSLVLSGTTVDHLLLRDADSLGWFDCLLVDSCFLLQLQRVSGS